MKCRLALAYAGQSSVRLVARIRMSCVVFCIVVFCIQGWPMSNESSSTSMMAGGGGNVAPSTTIFRHVLRPSTCHTCHMGLLESRLSMQPEVDATWKAGGTQDPWSSRLRLLEDSRKGQQIAKHCHNHGTLTNAPCTTHLCRFVTFY